MTTYFYRQLFTTIVICQINDPHRQFFVDYLLFLAKLK